MMISLLHPPTDSESEDEEEEVCVCNYLRCRNMRLFNYPLDAGGGQ